MVQLESRNSRRLRFFASTSWKKAFVSLSMWETHEQANAATAKAADWVKTNGRDRFALRENYVGDLAIDTGSAKPVELAH